VEDGGRAGCRETDSQWMRCESGRWVSCVLRKGEKKVRARMGRLSSSVKKISIEGVSS